MAKNTIDYRNKKLCLSDEIWLPDTGAPMLVSDAIRKHTDIIDGMRYNNMIKLEVNALCYLVRMRNEKSHNPTGNTKPLPNKSLLDSMFNKLKGSKK